MQARKEEDLSHNHQPAKLLQAHRLPRKFDWCDPLDKGGLDLCTASWNQHIPQVRPSDPVATLLPVSSRQWHTRACTWQSQIDVLTL